jgi:TonB family protein
VHFDGSRTRRGVLFIAAAVFALFLTQSATQTQSPSERRVLSKVAPLYPEIAKRHRIKGVVKLEVIVERNGSVKSTKALGGSPLLIEAAIYAVSQWKFEPASKETTEILQIAFDYAGGN